MADQRPGEIDIAQAVANLRHERDVAYSEIEGYKAQAATMDQQFKILLGENEQLRARVADLEHRAAFYMRHSTELLTHLNDVGPMVQGIFDLIGRAQERARDAAYRPSHAAPSRPGEQERLESNLQRAAGTSQTSPPDDGAPPPKFLTERKEGE